MLTTAVVALGPLSTPTLRLSIRKSTRCEIVDESQIDPVFRKIEITEALNKAAILAALRNGEQVAGARLKESQNLVIK